MEVFEKLLDQELYSYFKTAKFYANPVFHAAHKVVDFYVEFENVIPLQIYEQIITYRSSSSISTLLFRT